MSTNETEDSKTTETSGENGNRTRRKTANASAKGSSAGQGGLVKAEKHEIIELSDRTRVVESDSLPNHRPITVSSMEVVDTLSSSGRRPVMANSFEVATTDTLPGHRPVAISTLKISDLDTLPGHRPIASNDIDEDPSTLMGYLD